MSLIKLSWEEDENPNHKKPHRSIILGVKRYMTPREIYEEITNPENAWPYKRQKELLEERDKALFSLDYLGALRISECLAIYRGQLEFQADRERWLISGVKLSKVRSLKNSKWRERHDKFREVHLPIPQKNGDRYRIMLSRIVTDYAQRVGETELLFPITRYRAYVLFNTYTGAWPHYFRACGMRYLYDAWEHDLVALCKYLKISERTAMRYLGSFEHQTV